MTAVVSVMLVAAAASVATVVYLSGGWVYASRGDRNACRVLLRVSWGKTPVSSFSLSVGPTA